MLAVLDRLDVVNVDGSARSDFSADQFEFESPLFSRQLIPVDLVRQPDPSTGGAVKECQNIEELISAANQTGSYQSNYPNYMVKQKYVSMSGGDPSE